MRSPSYENRNSGSTLLYGYGMDHGDIHVRNSVWDIRTIGALRICRNNNDSYLDIGLFSGNYVYG